MQTVGAVMDGSRATLSWVTKQSIDARRALPDTRSIAARWPAHDDGSIRPVDWRTPIVMVVGAVALWALPARFPQPAERQDHPSISLKQ
jgi:hypothetical protein